LSTYSQVIAVSVLVGGAWFVWRARAGTRGAAANLCLLALFVGLAGGRAEHVLLHWDYFAAYTAEAFDLRAGGLGWHGSVVGGLCGLWLGWRMLASEERPYVTFRALLTMTAPCLPLVMLAGWVGCGMRGCGYGAEVATLADYPPLIVAELPDVYGIVAPRFNTALYGAAWATLSGLVLILTARRAGFTHRRLWLALALAAAGMFMIGFARADAVPSVLGLRTDQILDGLFALIGLALWLRARFTRT
jgi:prolipoprotein diacylglyceryltransferase